MCDVGVEERGSVVTVRHRVGDELRALEAELVVGADGLRSRVRTQLFGELPLRYSGVTCWRGIVDGIQLDRAIEAWGGRSRVGVVPLAGGRVYYFLVRGAARRSAAPSLETMREDFGGFGGDVGRVIDAALATDRPPLHHDLACALRDGLLRRVPRRVSDAQVTRLVTPGLALAGA